MIVGAVLWADSNEDKLFARFAVSNPRYRQHAPKIISRRQADESRTEFLERIRAAATRPPDFAGFYSVIQWSCGFVCQDLAIVDHRNGRISFLPFSVSQCRGQSGSLVRYRGYSRLLVVEGLREISNTKSQTVDVSKCETAYFEWTGTSCKRISQPSP